MQSGNTEAVISARFNGPPGSGNGGYSCGVLAAHIAGPARIRLHVPPPLDKPMRITDTEDGGVQMHDGDVLVGSGAAAILDLDIPAAPSLQVAKEAMKAFPAYDSHSFPTCFVCGPGRSSCDGLEIFPGPLPDNGAHQSLLACVWQPSADLSNAQGNICEEFLWSALDCPGYFAAMGAQLRPAVLGELTGEIKTAVACDYPLIVYAWPLGCEGRKYYGASAIATAGGDLVASSKSTWIELKP